MKSWKLGALEIRACRREAYLFKYPCMEFWMYWVTSPGCHPNGRTMLPFAFSLN